MAMENHQFIIKPTFSWGFSIAMFDFQRVPIAHAWTLSSQSYLRWWSAVHPKVNPISNIDHPWISNISISMFYIYIISTSISISISWTSFLCLRHSFYIFLCTVPQRQPQRPPGPTTWFQWRCMPWGSAKRQPLSTLGGNIAFRGQDLAKNMGH